MATVDIQTNPIVAVVGAKDSDATIIYSNISNDAGYIVSYQIEKISTAEVFAIDSNMGSIAGGNVIRVTDEKLMIILESRTKYRARAKHANGAWSAWVNFTSRDKRYQSPDAITSLTDDSDSSAGTTGRKYDNTPEGGNRTIVVTNNAKAAEYGDRRGYNLPRKWGPLTIVNTDTIYNDGQLQHVQGRAKGGKTVPVRYTNAGATIVNVPASKNDRIKYTNRGARIDTRG